MFLFIGTTELIIIGIIVVVLFGSKQIPNIVKGFKEVKQVKDDITDEIGKETKVIKDIKNISDSLKR